VFRVGWNTQSAVANHPSNVIHSRQQITQKYVRRLRIFAHDNGQGMWYNGDEETPQSAGTLLRRMQTVERRLCRESDTASREGRKRDGTARRWGILVFLTLAMLGGLSFWVTGLPTPHTSAAGGRQCDRMCPNGYLWPDCSCRPYPPGTTPTPFPYGPKGIGAPWQNWQTGTPGTNLDLLDFHWYYD
jgi:hypothetical protein